MLLERCGGILLFSVRFSNSDALLAHFLSFPVTSSLHELPTSVQNGTPLFHSLPASTKSIAVNTPGGK